MKKICFIAFISIAMLGMVSCGDDDDKPADETLYTVTFDSDGGTTVSPQTVKAGETATAPANPSKQGYTFLFWHVSGTAAAYDFQTPVSGNISLVAQWEEESGAEEEGGLAAVVAELGNDEDYSLFAAALSDVSAESGSYTVFALPDSIIRMDDETLPADELQWHVVRGKYEADELLQAQTLQTIGGQTLRVVRETAEIDGEEQTFLYINDVPVDYRSAVLTGGSAVYPLGTNIARISNVPGTDDLDAYNSWAALAIAGTWRVESVIKRRYYIWNDSYHEEEPYDVREDNTHVGCLELFKRDPAKVSQGCAGTYQTIHRCGGGESFGYSNSGYHAKGWWAVQNVINAVRIQFSQEIWVGGPLMPTDWFYFDTGIGRTIKYTSGYGDSHIHMIDSDQITGTYYETESTLRKIAN